MRFRPACPVEINIHYPPGSFFIEETMGKKAEWPPEGTHRVVVAMPPKPGIKPREERPCLCRMCVQLLKEGESPKASG